MSQTEKSISTPRRLASTLARSTAPADRSEAVTAKPFLASPIDWVPIPQATSRMVRTPVPQRSPNDPGELPRLLLHAGVPVGEDEVVERCQAVVEVVHPGSPCSSRGGRLFSSPTPRMTAGAILIPWWTNRASLYSD